MTSQELETAVRLELDLVVIVLNDNAFGMIKWKQQGMGFDEFGLDYGNPDFTSYARSYGAQGYLITGDDHFQQTLDHCLTTGGVHVIELPVDYSLNHEFLRRPTQILKSPRSMTCEPWPAACWSSQRSSLHFSTGMQAFPISLKYN